MYEAYYGFKEKPFSMLPDPSFLYLSKKHQTALTLLEYGLFNQVGFCVVSGDPGAGKTTILRAMLERVGDNVTVGLITNTHQSFGGLLDWILSVYDLHKPGLTHVEMHQIFMEYLIDEYAQKRSVLLIVDEAQNMNEDSLEELRMLSNVNSDKDHLLQVVLVGQPALKDMLRKPELMQFAQRIAVDYHLAPLNLEETCGYIQHRLVVAGAKKDVFTPAACERIFNYSGGTPRLINLLCETVLVFGFADQVEMIDVTLVEEMIQERMKDTVVPFVNKDKVWDDNAEANKELEENFPWIGRDDPSPEAVEPETVEKLQPENQSGLDASDKSENQQPEKHQETRQKTEGKVVTKKPIDEPLVEAPPVEKPPIDKEVRAKAQVEKLKQEHAAKTKSVTPAIKRTEKRAVTPEVIAKPKAAQKEVIAKAKVTKQVAAVKQKMVKPEVAANAETANQTASQAVKQVDSIKKDFVQNKPPELSLSDENAGSNITGAVIRPAAVSEKAKGKGVVLRGLKYGVVAQILILLLIILVLFFTNRAPEFLGFNGNEELTQEEKTQQQDADEKQERVDQDARARDAVKKLVTEKNAITINGNKNLVELENLKKDAMEKELFRQEQLEKERLVKKKIEKDRIAKEQLINEQAVIIAREKQAKKKQDEKKLVEKEKKRLALEHQVKEKSKAAELEKEKRLKADALQLEEERLAAEQLAAAQLAAGQREAQLANQAELEKMSETQVQKSEASHADNQSDGWIEEKDEPEKSNLAGCSGPAARFKSHCR